LYLALIHWSAWKVNSQKLVKNSSPLASVAESAELGGVISPAL
jgi:hypothetical protein